MAGVTPTRVALLGGTGSIGDSTLRVMAANPDSMVLHSLSGFRRVDALIERVRQWRPARVAVADEAARTALLAAIDYQPDVVTGAAGLVELAADSEADLVVAAIMGAAGLPSTMAAARAGKRIALANKEALVMAGDLMMQAVDAHGATLLPIDSEHNAIFQSLPADYRCGQPIQGLRQLWLTCSGGPFRDQPERDLSQVTPAQACKHPNWSMGQKISVDSATLMNKGLELIEACYLFNVASTDIRVVLHPQSIIHSLVEYRDGSFISQLGRTDMRVPIANALAHPVRVDSGVEPLDLAQLSQLTFDQPDNDRFPALGLARAAVTASQRHSIWLNAVNECAVEDFLCGRLRFDQIASRVGHALECVAPAPIDSLDAVLEADDHARRWYAEL
ncbi:1-deoxy-D-xylulose-5-phosphate reductoisomerase [Litorivicinus lipolyticus]|uniref:1-deoxy-D-xylulose 5-phosphate reductoisomerase n=1 Tax=Litorivicinus lipolyticus TaxID=418701 RepID=A0A5Q2QD65_9GAMM|nr:1-deoxy-D-xylulose-5-phosphate reductoisomerase [Litorivicinus lipolyticus]QGG79966.1 1-deoxy-D-xylulose-5-phosphate reductoisomerase [Litorivicinus lipolyticus]